MANFSGSPYYDRFNSDNQRTRVLFNPNRQLQQSELNELQSMQDYNLQLLGDALFTDGSLLSGMDINKNGNNVTIGNGFVYVSGKARVFKQQSIAISGSGIEELGVKVVQTIITSATDASLKDPTVGVPSSNSDGADRLKEDVVLTLNDPDSSTIYKYIDGNLFIDPPKPNYAVINDVLAQRTFEESGSYMVSGFKMWTETNTDPTKVTLVIDGGVAYVLGYRLAKPTPTRIALDKSTSTASIQNEGFFYSGTSWQNGKLGNPPVASITKVAAQIQVAKEGVNRGTTADGVDYLTNSAVFQVDNIWQEDAITGNVTATYTAGTDYQLQNGQQISWAPSGNEPDAGSTYYVSYKYTKTMSLSTDYTTYTSGSGDYPDTYVRFDQSAGTKPIEGSLVTVDYNYFLSREDLVTLDKDGNFTVSQGQPQTLRLVQPPTNVDPNTLPIGFVLVYPNSSNASAILHSIQNLTMEKLQKLSTRVDNLEYNQAVTALDQAAMQGKDPVTLRGVFSDGFISADKADLTNPNMTCSFSFEDAEIWLPYATVNVNVPPILSGSSTVNNWGRLVSAPFTEVKEVEQALASGSVLVNPYSVFNKQGILSLSPSSDNWIDTTNITTTKTTNETFNVNRWWYHGGKTWDAESEYIKNNIVFDNGSYWTGWNSTETGTIIENGGQQIKDTLIEFMRPIQVELTATNLTPSDDNLYLTFDSQRVPLTPSSGYQSGTIAGSVKSNALGKVVATFTIPPNVRCGTREVVLRNDNNMAVSNFTAQGTQRTVEDIIIKRRITAQLYDPVAQSFTFPEDRVLTGIDLYFANKSATDNVTIQVRELSQGGYPSNVVCGERLLTPDLINTSADGSVATTVRFDDPLMCTAGQGYCVVIITDSNEYSMWIATLGSPRIDNPSQLVMSQPYVNGVLFTSSNAQTWTADQKSDLKFSLYTARFNETGVIVFNPISNITMDKVVLMASYLTPQNTGCVWEMKLVLNSEDESVTVASKSWQPIGNYQDYDINQVARQIQLQATFTANAYISPLLSLEDITLAAFTSALDGSYVSRTIDASVAPFNHLSLSYEAFLPLGCTLVPKYSLDGGASWNTFTVSPTATAASGSFTKYAYSQQLSTTQTYTSIKFMLTMHAPSSFLRPRARRLMCNWDDL